MRAKLEIIGVNPFIRLPDKVLTELFKQAGKDKGSIRVKGTVNDKPFIQTLVKYAGIWRLYINQKILKNSTKRIGETIRVTVEYDPKERVVFKHPKFIKALEVHQEAKQIFDNLRPSSQHEIYRYIAGLKTEESIDKNVTRAVDFLLGKSRFVGRDKP